ncbi:PTS sugar transporter subunit IIB, partial [Bacillus anthracis]|uniref:PTS sugar transporter subunit IIB n=2 Tax=Bacillota TaxID=1239 RepID=UPI000D4D9715
MSKPNIVLTRVDNRLVHGQVGLTWTTSLGVNLVIVADDKILEDKFQQDLMRVITNT